MSDKTMQVDFDSAATSDDIKQATGTISIEEIKRRSLSGAISYSIRSLFLQAIGVLSYFLLSALLTPSDFGVYGIVVALSSFFTIISDVGLAASLIQKKGKPTIVELRTVFSVQQVLAWIVCMLIIATALFMHANSGLELSGVYLAAAFAFSFPIVSLKTISSILLERDLEFGKLALPVVVEAIVFNGVVIFFASQGMGVTSYALAVLSRAIIGVAVMFAIKRWPIGLAWSKEAFAGLMKVGMKFQANDMLAKVKDELFTVITSFLLSKQEIGYIQWATQASRYPYRFSVESVMAVTFPTFARLQHDAHALRRAIEKTLFFITFAAFPLLAGFAVMFIPLTDVIGKYAQWKPALPTLLLFCVSIAFSTISTPLVNTLNAIGKINTSLQLMVGWTLMQWILTPLFIWQFGSIGVAIASLCISCTVVIVVRLVQQTVVFSFLDQVWRQAISALVMGAALYVLIPFWSLSVMHFILGIGSGAILFACCMAVLGFSKTRQELTSLIQKR